jgi:hypothetical protein
MIDGHAHKIFELSEGQRTARIDDADSSAIPSPTEKPRTLARKRFGHAMASDEAPNSH